TGVRLRDRTTIVEALDSHGEILVARRETVDVLTVRSGRGTIVASHATARHRARFSSRFAPTTGSAARRPSAARSSPRRAAATGLASRRAAAAQASSARVAARAVFRLIVPITPAQ